MQTTLDRIDTPEEFIYDPSLVLHLPLHMLDGTEFMDRSAYGHKAVVTGALWTPRGRWFDNEDDYINCGQGSSLNIGTVGSLEVWVKADDPTAFDVIAGWEISPLWPGLRFAIYLRDGYWMMALSDGTNTQNSVVISPTSTSWTHLIATIDGSRVKGYANGELKKDIEQTVIPALENVPFHLSTCQSSPNYNFGGLIGEVRIYTWALTLLEIKHNYLATKWRYR